MASKIRKTKDKCPKCRFVVKNVDSICCDKCDCWFHVKCAKLTKTAFQELLSHPGSSFICVYCRDFPCGKCNVGVFPHNNALCCDNSSCNQWFHIKCTKVSLAQYKALSHHKNTDTWFCDPCLSIPFSNVSNQDLVSVFHDPPSFDVNQFPNLCSVCSRHINYNKKHRCLPCHSCMSLVHRKCTSLSLSLINSMNKCDLLRWECLNCQHEKFPFSGVASKDIVADSFNSNYDCPCRTTCPTSIFKRNEYRLDLFKKSDDKFYLQQDVPDDDQGTKIDSNFDYYEDHEFHKLLKSETLFEKPLFSIFHSNIQSLQNKIENIHILLSNLGHSFDIIALTETWTDSSDKSISIGSLDGYNKFQPTLGKSLKGGCGFYVKNGIQVREHKELDISVCDANNEYETKWIEIVNTNSKNIMVGVCYRHPRKSSNDSFCKYLEKTITTVNKKNVITFIVGDFNYNILNQENDLHSANFLDTMMCNNFQPCILEPTRVTVGNKPSLIDNIFINTLEKELYSGNLMSKLSDHLPQFIIVKDLVKKRDKKNRTQRDFSNFEASSYKNDLKGIKLAGVNFFNVDVLFNSLHEQYTDIIEKHAPLKTYSVKEFSFKQKPWITRDIQHDINLKHKYNAKFVRTKSLFWYNRYKILNKKVRQAIFESKKQYYRDYFTKNLKNLKKVWSGLNDLIAQKKKSNKEEIFLNDVEGISQDQKRVAELFNKYFTNVAKNLVLELGNPNTQYQDYLKNPNEHSLYLNEVDPGELREIISKLDEGKSGDVYGVTPFLLKVGCEELLDTLTMLFNRTFIEGVFPSVLKFAKVIPIHKGDSKFSASNYRPIALLPILGKCLEKLMHSRIYGFLSREKILFKSQYGFQKGKSTEQAVFDIHEKIVESLENRETPCCVFLDLAKAFDTVNKDILLYKLNHYGIRGRALEWLNSYLSNRKQCVNVNGINSENLSIDIGVPQGSILGPLLFLLYINDFPECSKLLQFVMFADDTCLFVSHKNLENLQNLLESELTHVYDWLVANKLSLNVKKTNFMAFQNMNGNNTTIDIKVNGHTIPQVKVTKYLGVHIDDKLTFKNHTSHIANKLSKGNRLLAKLRHFTDQSNLLNFYHANLHSHINYCSNAWGSAAESYIKRLGNLQNKSLNLISFKKLDPSNSDAIYKENRLLPVNKAICLNQCLFIWKIVHSVYDDSMQSKFDHILRHQNFATNYKFILPYRRLTAGQRSLTHAGIKNWNKLTQDIRSLTSMALFKKAVLVFLNN